MFQFTHSHFLVNKVRMTYYRTGGDKPPMILLHGFSDNALCWNRVPGLLAKEFDVIMLDARGHGSSGIDEMGTSAGSHADDLLELIHQLDLHQPVLWGHSMGAETAALTAAQAPELIRAVILEDPPWREPHIYQDETFFVQRKESWQELIHLFQTQTEGELIEDARKRNPAWEESEFPPWAHAKKQMRPEVIDWLTAERELWFNVVCRIKCPGLLLTADQSLGAIVSKDTARQVVSLWPAVTVVSIPGAGHCIHREQLDAVLQAVDRFLNALKPWR